MIYFRPNYPCFHRESIEWLNKGKYTWHHASPRNSEQLVLKGKNNSENHPILHGLTHNSTEDSREYLSHQRVRATKAAFTLQMANGPPMCPFSATLWAHKLQETCAEVTERQWMPTPPTAAPWRTGVRIARTWGSGVPGWKWLIDSWPSLRNPTLH